MVRVRGCSTLISLLLLSYFWVHPAQPFILTFNGSTTPVNYSASQNQYGIEIIVLRLGLDAGSIIDMKINLKPTGTVAVLAVYSYIQIVNLLQSTSFKRTTYPSTARYEISGTTSVKVQLPLRNRYYMALLVPPSAGAISYDGTALFLNPGPFSGSKYHEIEERQYTHLAVEDYYLPVSSYIMLGLFTFLSSLWAWRIRPARIRMYPIQHMFMVKHITAALFTQVVSYLLASFYYYTYETWGWVDNTLQIAQGMAAVAANAVFLLLLLLTSMGYTVSRMFLSFRERQLLALAFTSLVLFSSLYATCSKTSANDVCMSFYLGVQVVKFLVTFAVILQLHNQIDLVRDACQSQHATSKSGLDLVLAGYRKLRALTLFRWVILTYLALPVAFLFTSFNFLSWVDEKWLPVFAESVSVWFVLTTMALAMSPGKYNILDGSPLPQGPEFTTDGGLPLENMSARRRSELIRDAEAERVATEAVRTAMLAALSHPEAAPNVSSSAITGQRSDVVDAGEEDTARIRALPTLKSDTASGVPEVKKQADSPAK